MAEPVPGAGQVLVRTPDAARLADLVAADGGQVRPSGGGALTVTGVSAPRVAELAARERIVVHELTPQRASLEEAFLELTAGSQEFSAQIPAVTPGGEAHHEERTLS